MKVVAGLTLKNLNPRVWDDEWIYHLKDLTAVMVSYADFQQMRVKRREAMQCGLRSMLNIPKEVAVYLDNGAFSFATNGGEPSAREYREFWQAAEPDWRPVRFDSIPTPRMHGNAQRACFMKTMKMNVSYQHDGYVPVVHVGRHLKEYLDAIEANVNLKSKECLAIGGIVPNLLRSPKAATYSDVLDNLVDVRKRFPSKRIHVFGIGGTATIHMAALLGFDSVDSCGWRNRAARGIIQMAGSGERLVAQLGSWRGRRPSAEEWKLLKKCQCPACLEYGCQGLKESGQRGFCNRATHNLWILLEEAKWVERRLANDNYEKYFRRRLDNTTYLPIIERLLELLR